MGGGGSRREAVFPVPTSPPPTLPPRTRPLGTLGPGCKSPNEASAAAKGWVPVILVPHQMRCFLKCFILISLPPALKRKIIV